MIKVQPARSRVLKSETPDSITLVHPPSGMLSLAGFLVLLSGGWLAGSLWLLVAALGFQSRQWEVLAVALLIPGIIGLVSGIAYSLSTWRFERDSESLRLTRNGIIGTRVRRWPATDISSLWVEESAIAKEHRCYLVVGFRNGRSEEVMSGTDQEELRWLAAMLSDSRGSRASPEVPLQAPEPVRRRIDENTVPPTLGCRRYDSGAEIRFRPMIEAKGRVARFLGIAGAAFVAIVVLSLALSRMSHGRIPARLMWLPLAIESGLVAAGLWSLCRNAVIQIHGGTFTLIQNYSSSSQTFRTDEIEFVQTFRGKRRTELQILLRDKPKLRLFEGRPADELEWAARFIRVALKGRHQEETAPMRVDASEGRCEVCGETMANRVVYCAKCRTPHHEECWSYVGQCSTYGCREIRFTRA